MKKGTVVGGQANGDTARKAPRGMLPPTGAGPVEVTPEWVAEQQQASGPAEGVRPNRSGPALESSGTSSAPAQTTPRGGADSGLQLVSLLPSEIVASLKADLPAASDDVRTVIAACERRLHAAGMLHESMKKKALDAYFYYAGPAVRLVHATESWRETVDPATGAPCRSWSAWLRSVKVSRQQAERMTKEEPLMQALKGLDVKQLNTSQIDALAPVLNNFGVGEVRRLWAAALGWGDISGPSLLRLRAQLGLEPDRAISEGEEKKSPAATPPVLRFQTTAGTFDASQVRAVARTQPQIARLVAQTILDELGPEESESEED